ncbi:hypothetical protein N4T57_03745 [Campylobacter hepaticus]|uniref:Type II secretion system protein n=1 Tax=Campylobacter hepaticus TaxID=1813019 RepID=A0A424Z1U0_9BACT|nr:transformation system protein [Campylobacter hepaticus]AXP08436.1 type II secretion system protein [Campylobacter hepaticus]MCZ0772267.1 hypothetical protein [Campylobacter hepaticus]MCZ0773735.1 hypothetical protein [Campylobacter hepaticus]MCZ0774986.1 hypothetical protein [Campylobacter hepaticus]MDX2322854.1 hypothetical protein [Campylobacter hepaticus]
MKKAFILIELINAMIIISLIFTGIFYYYTHLYKNYENLNTFEKLYKLQNQLYEKPMFKTIILKTSNLKTMILQEQFSQDHIFKFQKLYFQNQNYNIYFKE